MLGIIDKAIGDFIWKWGRGELGHLHDPNLLGNGNFLVSGRTGKGPVTFGGRSGRVMELDWAGNKVWQYVEKTPKPEDGNLSQKEVSSVTTSVGSISDGTG